MKICDHGRAAQCGDLSRSTGSSLGIRLGSGGRGGVAVGMDNVRLMTRTTITGAYDGKARSVRWSGSRIIWHNRPARRGAKRACRVLLADRGSTRDPRSGCTWSGPLRFENNDRPGDYDRQAPCASYLNRWGVVAAGQQGGHLFCNNDDAHRTAARSGAWQGVEVAAHRLTAVPDASALRVTMR